MMNEKVTCLTVADVASRWRRSETSVRRLIRNGELVASRIGKDLRITVEEAERFLATTATKEAR
jgi:excisionase family DNA binding protein